MRKIHRTIAGSNISINCRLVNCRVFSHAHVSDPFTCAHLRYLHFKDHVIYERTACFVVVVVVVVVVCLFVLFSVLLVCLFFWFVCLFLFWGVFFFCFVIVVVLFCFVFCFVFLFCFLFLLQLPKSYITHTYDKCVTLPVMQFFQNNIVGIFLDKLLIGWKTF